MHRNHFQICTCLGFALTLTLCGVGFVGAVDREPSARGAGTNVASMEMNGYTLQQFGDFVHDWHLVTVRFRRDSGEQRFVYANDIAWQALNARSTDYPDGAVFAKVAAMTQEDPAFVDSAVPSGARRVQFMVRDHERHRETDGWGYELFSPGGRALVPGKVKDVVDACNACHLIVPERGLVFSEPMVPLLSQVASLPALAKSTVLFVTVDVAALPDFVRTRMPPGFTQARQMQGPLTQHVFSGTFVEAMPTVAAEAASANMPALLISQETPEFSVVWPVEGGKAECTLPGGQNGRTVTGGSTISRTDVPSGTLANFRPIPPFCTATNMGLRKDD